MTENDLFDLDNLDIDDFGKYVDLYETVENTEDSTDLTSEQKDQKVSLRKYKEVRRPKMCDRKDFILLDLMCNNCNRIADLMIKMNKGTEALLSIELDQISDEEYHKILHTADTINKILVDLNSLI